MTSMLDGLSNLITGGASGGGAAAAHMVSGYGDSVAVADIDRDAAEATAEAIRGKGGSAIAIAAEVVDEAQVKVMVSAAVKAFGRLDGAVNNAGIANRPAEIGELELADWTRPMSIDLLGAWLCMKYELEVMQIGRAHV